MADVKGEPINIKVKPGGVRQQHRELPSLLFPPCRSPIADGEEIMFKVKTTTQMKKIFDAYATRSGQQVIATASKPSPIIVTPRSKSQKDSLLFMLNGSNVAETDTPASVRSSLVAEVSS